MKQITAEAFEHANVTGKKLQYIRLTNGEKEHIITVGLKTYEAVKNMEDDTNTNQPPNGGSKPNGNQGNTPKH